MKQVSRTILPVLLVVLLFSLPLTLQAQQSFQDRYSAGYALYQRGNYSEAIKHFRGMLADNMNSSLSDNCQYWIGEAYFAKKEFEQAIIEFDKVLFFANNNKREHSIYKIAFCHENLGEKKQALEMYKRYLADYPNGDYSKLALKKLDELQY